MPVKKSKFKKEKESTILDSFGPTPNEEKEDLEEMIDRKRVTILTTCSIIYFSLVTILCLI